MKSNEVYSITLLDGEVIKLFDKYTYRDKFTDINTEIYSIEIDFQNGICTVCERDKKAIMQIPMRRIERIHTVLDLQRK